MLVHRLARLFRLFKMIVTRFYSRRSWSSVKRGHSPAAHSFIFLSSWIERTYLFMGPVPYIIQEPPYYSFIALNDLLL